MNEDTQKRIGTILDETAVRDAIHIAVAPLIAGEDLWAGREIGLKYGTQNVAVTKDRVYGLKAVGIVDPFIDGPVRKGQQFYCFLFPNTVTGMTHHWKHPLFDDPIVPPKSKAEKWLRELADRWDFDYDELLESAQERGGYIVAHGRDLHGVDEFEDREGVGAAETFWQNVEAVTGKSFDRAHRDKFVWSCSC